VRIIFSRDRPAQLDLLLRSLERNMEPDETHIIWHATDPRFLQAYGGLVDSPMQEPGDFDGALRFLLEKAGETVTFFCDDDVVFREVPGDPAELLLSDDRILTVCLYLGQGNVKQEIPEGFPIWEWPPLDRHDFGFPCAVDGNTYRPADVLRLLGGSEIENPTWMETFMLMRLNEFVEERPLMASFVDQCVVGVPVNRTSASPGAPSGRDFPQDAHDLNWRFLGGERIDFDRLDFSAVNSCHYEVNFVWRRG
jgi:hypothetical protein